MTNWLDKGNLKEFSLTRKRKKRLTIHDGVNCKTKDWNMKYRTTK